MCKYVKSFFKCKNFFLDPQRQRTSKYFLAYGISTTEKRKDTDWSWSVQCIPQSLVQQLQTQSPDSNRTWSVNSPVPVQCQQILAHRRLHLPDSRGCVDLYTTTSFVDELCYSPKQMLSKCLGTGAWELVYKQLKIFLSKVWWGGGRIKPGNRLE